MTEVKFNYKFSFLKIFNLKVILFLGSCLIQTQCTSSIDGEYQIEAIYTSIPPLVDGNLIDSVWSVAKPVMLRKNHSGEIVSDPELITQVKTCYTDTALYIAFLCKDPDIWTSFTRRDEHLWKEEAVEVFIDVDPIGENYVEIEVSPANVLFDSFITDHKNIDIPVTSRFDLPGIRTAVRVDGTLNERDDRDNCWIVEISIPFEDLITEDTAQVSARSEIKINFFRLDKNQDTENQSYAWSPTGDRFHKPSVFGKLIFN